MKRKLVVNMRDMDRMSLLRQLYGATDGKIQIEEVRAERKSNSNVVGDMAQDEKNSTPSYTQRR